MTGKFASIVAAHAQNGTRTACIPVPFDQKLPGLAVPHGVRSPLSPRTELWRWGTAEEECSQQPDPPAEWADGQTMQSIRIWEVSLLQRALGQSRTWQTVDRESVARASSIHGRSACFGISYRRHHRAIRRQYIRLPSNEIIHVPDMLYDSAEDCHPVCQRPPSRLPVQNAPTRCWALSHRDE